MPDTKEGREEQARREEDRQHERELAEALERSDEPEPPRETAPAEGSPRTCHRRGCEEPATFRVMERYLEETGHGPVEAQALLCAGHTEEEGPTNLDHAYEDYVFLVEPLPVTPQAERA